jgi:hypothetical protein
MAYVAITASTFASVTTTASSQIAATGLTGGPLQLGQYLYLLRCDQATWYAQGPATQNFTYTGSGNNFTIASNGFVNGEGPVQLTTSGTLPTGLSLATNYWLITVDPNTFAFATSRANAVAGTAVAISGAGSGTFTMTTTVTAGGAGCSLAQPSQEVILDGRLGAAVAVVEDSTAGKVSICQATWVR